MVPSTAPPFHRPHPAAGSLSSLLPPPLLDPASLHPPPNALMDTSPLYPSAPSLCPPHCYCARMRVTDRPPPRHPSRADCFDPFRVKCCFLSITVIPQASGSGSVLPRVASWVWLLIAFKGFVIQNCIVSFPIFLQCFPGGGAGCHALRPLE